MSKGSLLLRMVHSSLFSRDGKAFSDIGTLVEAPRGPMDNG